MAVRSIHGKGKDKMGLCRAFSSETSKYWTSTVMKRGKENGKEGYVVPELRGATEREMTWKSLIIIVPDFFSPSTLHFFHTHLVLGGFPSKIASPSLSTLGQYPLLRWV